MEAKDLNPGPRRSNRWLESVPASAVCPKWAFLRMDRPKPQKSSDTLSPQFNFVRPPLEEVSFEGRASESLRSVCNMEKHLAKDEPMERIQIGNTYLNFTLEVVLIWHLDQSEFGQSSISKHWYEKVGPACLRSRQEMNLQYNHWCPNKPHH